MTPEDVLHAFRTTGALLEGHFVLRSGKHSRQYFQCAHLLQYPAVAAQVCAALADKLREIECDSIASPAMGGILVGHEVARNLNKRHIFAEKQEGKLAIRRFSIQPGERFLVCEDVVTTGSAVAETCSLITQAGGIVENVGAIVDRSGGAPLQFDYPLTSLLALNVETFDADHLPADLQALPATKPGSK